MAGYADWGGKEFDVIQAGSRTWSGSVIIWKSGSHSAAHGRRIEESAAKQWAAGDTIKLQICQSKRIKYILQSCKIKSKESISISACLF